MKIAATSITNYKQNPKSFTGAIKISANTPPEYIKAIETLLPFSFDAENAKKISGKTISYLINDLVSENMILEGILQPRHISHTHQSHYNRDMTLAEFDEFIRTQAI